MRTISIRSLGILVFAFFWCVACTDHEPQQPQVVLPVVKTGASTFNSQTQTPTFHVQIESLGNVGITEYGIAYLLAPNGSNPANYNPTVSGPKVIFDLPATVGNHSKPAPFTDQQVDVYHYRAYAILQNGNVVYGEKFADD
ncbi:hypothetical protein [Dyadobacter fermentans]|uniref:hypothetical protein n=1 Tax=Dyadobacter fermentans TaxID=94254 RepID=UPI00019B5539|nr:hypothetical protein [Dyadobacter fermentans]